MNVNDPIGLVARLRTPLAMVKGDPARAAAASIPPIGA